MTDPQMRDRQGATAFWRACRARSIELLGLERGMRALDVGCGTGEAVRAIAALGAEAIGVDSARAVVAEAQARTRTDETAAFRVADPLALPFEDGHFDAVRCERALQHVADPRAALREMARAARPGAAVVAVEPDWDTLVVEAEPFEVTLAVCHRWADSIRQPRAGRRLPALMAEAGLARVSARADTSVISDARFAEEQLGLVALADGAAAAGEVRAEEVERWLADVRARDLAGRFEASVTYVTARGFVPRSADP